MKEITLKRIFSELIEIIELKRGLLKTLYFLLYSPKLVIDGYRENFRGNYSGPLRILFTYSIFTIFTFIIFESLIPWEKGKEDFQKINPQVGEYFNLKSDYIYDKNLSKIQQNINWLNRYKYSFNNLIDKDKKKVLKISKFVEEYQLFISPLYTIPFTIAIYSIFTFLIFRGYFKRYIEHFCINIYSISIIGIIKTLIDLLTLLIFKMQFLYSAGYVIISTVIIFFFGLRTYSKLFELKNKYYNWIFLTLIMFINPINSADIGWYSFNEFLINNIHLPLLDYLYNV